jgi:imidazoleglycerol-phosphate dehydratase
VRKAEITRNTSETQIELNLSLEGRGKYDILTGCGFLDHMLELFTRHGDFDIYLRCVGDIHVDYHHTAEDVAIVLGRAFAQALGDMRGIKRYGSFILPMDEALIMAAVDLSGRAFLASNLSFPTEKIGDFDTELVNEFMSALCRCMGATIHLRQLDGANSHHIAEAAFKALARALKEAVSIDEKHLGDIPSTKGVIDM